MREGLRAIEGKTEAKRRTGGRSGEQKQMEGVKKKKG